ncbi:MAG: elongation factor Ts [Chitinispirillaceae bacterium]|nr:elongation factor Ts [Chitinispirillaceae bacterium]
MEITAAQVKELREKTGIGMMICKKALIENNGDMELAIESLRKQGQATAEKRAGKAVKQGTVSVVADTGCSILYEVNSETDFVARNDDFVEFIKILGTVLLAQKPADIAAARTCSAPELGGQSVDGRVTELIGKIGENITFRRYRKLEADVANERIFSYIHGEGKIGVLVKLSSTAGLDSEELALLGKDLAMQVTAANPMAIDREHVDASVLAKEKEIYFTQAQTSGKPEKIWDKIVEGKMTKFFQEMTLVEQGFIRNPDTSVTDRIKETEKALGATVKVLDFIRFELGAEE